MRGLRAATFQIPVHVILSPVHNATKKARMTKAKFDHTGYRPIWHWTSISMVEAAPLSGLVRLRVYGLGRQVGL